MNVAEPSKDCPLCPRLVAFRHEARASEPGWFNAPVPTFGPTNARLLIVGLAPGLRGANRTGRPFTGDFAGDLLYATLCESGLANGGYARSPDDGLTLVNCTITNAVRCVPPQNKPSPNEITTCRQFLTAQIGCLADLRIIVALGRIAHESVVRALGGKLADFPFAHGRRHVLRSAGSMLALHDSYHCSRYNTSTRVLTEAMFKDVFARVKAELDETRPEDTSCS